MYGSIIDRSFYSQVLLKFSQRHPLLKRLNEVMSEEKISAETMQRWRQIIVRERAVLLENVLLEHKNKALGLTAMGDEALQNPDMLHEVSHRNDFVLLICLFINLLFDFFPPKAK